MNGRVLLLLAVVVPGCVPIEETYYRPSGPGTLARSHPCDRIPDTREIRIGESHRLAVTAYRTFHDPHVVAGAIRLDGPNALSYGLLTSHISVFDVADPTQPASVSLDVQINPASKDNRLFVNWTGTIPEAHPFSVVISPFNISGNVTSEISIHYEQVTTAVLKPIC